jgi:hypothetical protein
MSADGQRRNAPPPSAARTDPRLEQLLAHPALWRAGSAARGALDLTWAAAAHEPQRMP